MVKFSGGDKLEAKLAELARNVSKAATVEIGFMGDVTEADGQTTAFVAAMNEYGDAAHNRPPRQFFRGMIKEHSDEWPEGVSAALIANNYDASKTLGQVGAHIEGQLKEAIMTYVGPPLSPKTIAKKGFDKQLVDTSAMLKSVAHVVK